MGSRIGGRHLSPTVIVHVFKILFWTWIIAGICHDEPHLVDAGTFKSWSPTKELGEKGRNILHNQNPLYLKRN